jgi:hypothetical protein
MDQPVRSALAIPRLPLVVACDEVYHLHLEGRVAPAFQLPLAGLQDTPESFFSWVNSTFTLLQVNPAKLITVLVAVACRFLRELADRFGHQTWYGRQTSLSFGEIQTSERC